MATTKVLEVRAMCPVCGLIDKFTVLGGTRFCSICLSQHLIAAGVPVMEMKTIEVEREVDEEGHYRCAHCGKLTANGRTCQHCGR